MLIIGVESQHVPIRGWSSRDVPCARRQLHPAWHFDVHREELMDAFDDVDRSVELAASDPGGVCPLRGRAPSVASLLLQSLEVPQVRELNDAANRSAACAHEVASESGATEGGLAPKWPGPSTLRRTSTRHLDTSGMS